MRIAYHQALDELRVEIIRAGGLAIEAVRQAAKALAGYDAGAAATIVAADDVIDRLRHRIEAECIELMWRQQPVAGELREVAAVLQIVTDIERVGDYAVDIAKNAITIARCSKHPLTLRVSEMVESVLAMLTDAIKSYASRDATIAANVESRDADVDVLYKRNLRLLEEEMRSEGDLVRAGTCYVFVVASLERAGDRAANIAHHTIEML